MHIALGGGLPPLAYIILNIDPVLVYLGSIAIHWYGLAYVVAILVGLLFLVRWTRREGIHDDQLWGLFVWAAIAGLVGGRLYFVIQQPDLVQQYLLQPLNIIAVWNGGMAFFGAIFLASATVFALAPRYGLDRFIVMDGGAFFAAIGQIFGRFGNIVNGDIVGLHAGPPIPTAVCTAAASGPWISFASDPNTLPWAVVYVNPHTFAQPCIPYHPAPVYEMLINLAMLAIIWPLRYKLPQIRAGLLFLLYLALYAVGQFIVFFYRGSEPTTPFLGIDVFKQAQWTAIFTFLACIPLYFLIQRYSRPWPFSDKHPVPWPLPAGGMEAARAAAVSGAAAAATPGRAVAAAPAAVAPAVVAPAAVAPAAAVPQPRASLSAATAATPSAAPAAPFAVAPESPAVELPPWQPHRPVGGGLRNQFGPGKSAPV
jgi:phosphatidylglycerol:prolipoprotein diacylglycerol transferase